MTVYKNASSIANKRVFVFGAGVSRFAGFPLGKNLWDFLLDHIGLEIGPMEWIDAYLDSPAEPVIGTDDLELLLTQAKEYLLRRKETAPYSWHSPVNRKAMRTFFEPYKHLMANRRWRPFEMTSRYKSRLVRRSSSAVAWNNNATVEISRIIAAALAVHHACVRFGGRHFNACDEDWSGGPEFPRSCPCYREFALRKHRQVVEAFVRKMRAGDTVITFNYDALVESILWQARKWTPSNGYGFDLKFDRTLLSVLRRKAPRTLANSPVTVLKAHGSFNWLRNCYDGSIGLNYLKLLFDLPIKKSFVSDLDAGRIVDADDLADVGPDFPNVEDVILAPVYKKHYDSDPSLRLIWRMIDLALEGADEVVVVGYSLPPGDVDANARITAALRQNPKCRFVTVVSPCETNWHQCLYTAGKDYRPVLQKFEEWLLP
jgi:hypothetical protein